MEEDDLRYIIIVGRSETSRDFLKKIKSVLPEESFQIAGAHSLDQYSEIDSMDRYIVFIESTLEGNEWEKKSSVLVEKFRIMGLGAYAFNSLDEAVEYAEAEYDFESDDSKIQERLAELRKRFPPFTAKEVEQASIFDSLYHTGKIRPIRARYKDEEAIVLAHFAAGSDEILVTPMFLMITDGIHDELEIPFK